MPGICTPAVARGGPLSLLQRTPEHTVQTRSAAGVECSAPDLRVGMMCA